MTTALLMRVAGVSALLALLALLLAGTFLVLFFRRGQPYGSLNDFFSALALLLLILPAAAVYVVAWNDVGWWLLLLTIAAVAGMALAAAGQLLLILRIIDLRTSFVTGGVGIAPVLAWLGGTAWLALAQHLLPEAVGWFGAAALGSAA
ncbi:MAG: hypothetical protein ABI939_11785, partial [Anaerolineaceae bacterium]